MQSSYHNLPTINGVQQAPGHQYAARDAVYNADDRAAELTLDIAGAYPKNAGVKSWVRTVALNRGADITITDTYDLESVSGDIVLNLITACDVALQDGGQIALKTSGLTDSRTSGAAQLHYDAEKLTASIEEISIEDSRLKGIWGDRLTRVLLKAKNPLVKDTWELRITKP
jgi:hypothetical protein